MADPVRGKQNDDSNVDAIIDSCVERFETAWRTDSSTSLAGFAQQLRSDVPSELLPACLRELAKVDLEYRCKSFAAVPIKTAEDYARQFPEVELDIDLIEEEFRCRSKWGDRPDVDEIIRGYSARFPDADSRLKRVAEEIGGSASSQRTQQHGKLATQQAIGTPLIDKEMPAHIGRYKVVKRLGVGAFGQVLLAEDPQLQRSVAIKLAHTTTGTHSSISEAIIACSISHPNLVAIFDIVSHNGTDAIVMEYVEGTTLHEALAEAPPTRREALIMIVDLARALHECHRNGVYHCDFKPANVLIGANRCPRIADFGLSVEAKNQRRLPGHVAGSPAYMAPEQVRGEVQWLDGRTDIWAIGVILYEMLVARRPFDGENTDHLFDEILYREPRALRQIDDTISADVERICQRCLSKRIADRYSTCKDLADDVSRFLAQDSLQHASTTTASTELPAPPSLPGFRPTIGRNSDLARITQLLREDTARVVCLVGPGGIGKTSVALEAADRLQATFSQQTFVDLTNTTTPDAFLDQLLQHHNVPRPKDATNDSLLDTIIEAMRRRGPSLLILDNFEQLTQTSAPIIARLSSALPHVKLLITSRVRIRMTALRTIELAPLETSAKSANSGTRSPAAQLFETCAQDHEYDFQLADENIADVNAICERLDGIPLAIELAASQISLFSPIQILARLQDRNRFFSEVRSNDGQQQRTLAETILWSYELLSEEAQAAIALLTLLPAGVFPEQAEQALSQGTQTKQPLNVIRELRNHSLVRTIETPFGKRLSIFRSIADPLEELREELSNERRQRMKRAVQLVMLEYLERNVGELRTANGLEATDRIMIEAGNLVAIQRRASARADDETVAAVAEQLTAPLLTRGSMATLDELWNRAIEDTSEFTTATCLIAQARYLNASNQWKRAESILQRALVLAVAKGTTDHEQQALVELAAIASARGDFAEARKILTRVSEAAHSPQPAVRLDALSELGHVTERIGNLASAVSIYDDALRQAESLGDLATQTKLLRRKGNVAIQLGDFPTAEMLLEKSLRLATATQSLTDRHLVLTSLGVVHSEKREYARAIAYYDRSQTIATEIGARRSIATNESNRGVALADLGDHVAAIHCFCVAESINLELGNKIAAAINLGNQAVSQAAIGSSDAAIETIERALGLLTQQDEITHRAIIQGDYGIIEFHRNQPAKATRLLDEAMSRLKQVGLAESPSMIPLLTCRILCARQQDDSKMLRQLQSDENNLKRKFGARYACHHPLLKGTESVDR